MNGSKKERILIVEDEALVARELKSRLIQMGWEVAGIAYGEEAIELARETRPDLLLTDIHLKGGANGIEVAQKICEEMDIPVVFLTAYSDAETVAKAKSVTPFGYIIKPVENREMQITIDMALYKFKIDKELKETQQLLQTALTCIGSALVFVDESGHVVNVNRDASELFCNREVVGKSWKELLGQVDGSSVLGIINVAFAEKGIARLPPFVVQVAEQEVKLMDGIVGPMDAGGVLILRELAEISDSLEMLAEPADMLIDRGREVLSPTESTLCQILISPDSVNEGDAEKIVEKLSHQIDPYVRATDLVSVFGGSLLSVSMPYTSVSEGELIARTLLNKISNEPGLEEETRFSIGLAHSVAGDKEPIELFRRARLALNNARSSGGGTVVTWKEEFEASSMYRSSEIHQEREYHNLVLLWNIMNVLSRAQDLEALALGFCEHIFQFFKLDRIGLLVREEQSISAIAGFGHGKRKVDSIADLHLSAEEFHLLDRLISDGSGEVTLGCIHYFGIGGGRALLLDSIDTNDSVQSDFLHTLVSYFSTGLSRFDLCEVPELAKNSGGSDGLIFRSPQVSSIVESAKLVAPTDATVLIVGDSGTGKELLAKYVHDESSRSQNPFIIVDCGAVVGSLIESELFGHVRGAFTGADKNYSGRVKEAVGGTVLLDEIGELPLDIQVKLLRFVEDRKIIAVGASEYQSVDTRIIAATNRDLKQMVEDGTFREDLYYRLNVFTITTPRLEDRKEDILPIAHHWLDAYARRYGKGKLGFSPEAEQVMLQHNWPGNVRELINVINRAVILCKDSRVNPIHLGLFSRPEAEISIKPIEQFSLRKSLKEIVDLSLELNPKYPPIGQWMEDDLILISMHKHAGVLNRAATSLGIPESTMRRKVSRLKASHQGEQPYRPDGWIEFNKVLNDLDDIAAERGIPLLELVSQSLVREIESRNIARQDAAKLMGVSVPTYRRLVS